MIHLIDDHEGHCNQHENKFDEKEHPFNFEGTLMQTMITRWSKFPKGGKATVEQILGQKTEINPKKAEL